MEVTELVTDVSSSVLIVYNLSALAFLLYGFYKFGLQRHILFVSFLYTFGLFGFLEYQFGISADIYKVVLALFLVFICGKGVLKIYGKEGGFVYAVFVLFTLSYIISHFANNQVNISVFSQYIISYAFPFIIYQGYKNLNLRPEVKGQIIDIITFLLAVQVVLSGIKMGLLGGVMEAIVGSVQFLGGGTAVSLPILGLLFLWVIRSGRFKKRDWLIAISFLIIAIASAKRTPVLMFPLFFVLLFSFANKANSVFSILKYVPVFLGLVYVGVRLNYTLNPEGVIWGSFDLNYLINYILLYNFGTTDLSMADTMTSGRGGALFLITRPEALGLHGWGEILFGHGVVEAVREESGRFLGGAAYGIQHQGLMGAVVQEIYKMGYLGVGFFLLFIIAIVNQIKNNRFKYIVIMWLLVDVFLYNGTTLFHPTSSFLFVIIVLFSSKKLQ